MLKSLSSNVTHPCCHRLTLELLEGCSEGAVASESTLLSQFLSRERFPIGNSLAIDTDEMLDTQPVDIGIISGVLMGEIQAEVTAVSADNLAKVVKADVVTQIKLRTLATML